MNYKMFGLMPLCLLSIRGQSQKLPNIQQESIYIEKPIKIDGKANDWGNEFKAYNRAVDLAYSIANDDEKLYLVVYATKPRIIDKIVDVGATFIVNNAGKKASDSKENMSFTYPILDVKSGQRILMNVGKKVKSDVVVPVRPNIPEDTTYKNLPTRNDSLVAIANNLMAVNAKTIAITGVKDIPDDLSVYNEQGIVAVGKFDKDGNYTYELSIPIKLLMTSEGKFSYSIRLNSRLLSPKSGMRTHYIYPNGHMQDVDQDLDSTTDFWGEYVLAKKKL